MTSEIVADTMSHRSLKSKQRRIRENFPENLGLRVHRALSWLERAEKETEDQDAAFIFYWISFNAAYAKDDIERYPTGERSAFDEYFEKIISPCSFLLRLLLHSYNYFLNIYTHKTFLQEKNCLN